MKILSRITPSAHTGVLMSRGADPWSARDALVPLWGRRIKRLHNRTGRQGPAADEGVRPTTENYAALAALSSRAVTESH